MKIFLLAVAGAMAGLILLIALGRLWLKRRLRRLGAALGQLAAGSGVPPFRVTLMPVTGADVFEDGAAVDAATRSLEGTGYRRLDDFEIPELENVLVRGFWHAEHGAFAALVEHPQAGVFVDVVALFTDRSLLTVSSGPETGLERPQRAPRLCVALPGPGEVQRLHERLVAEIETSGRTPIPTAPEQFTLAFEGAYRMEQDWRIARGGPTADEVRRAAVAGGQAPPDDATVAQVQATWRRAIAEFVGDEALKAWLADAPLPAAGWEAQRERIRVVHEHSDVRALVETLAAEMVPAGCDEEDEAAWERTHAQARQQLEPLFRADGDGSDDVVRAGFARAQALLPEKRRYHALGSVDHPWPAEIYLEPGDGGPAR